MCKKLLTGLLGGGDAAMQPAAMQPLDVSASREDTAIVKDTAPGILDKPVIGKKKNKASGASVPGLGL